MIHVNRNGKHEWLTREQFEAKYGKLPESKPRSTEAERLNRMRVDAGLSFRKMGERIGLKPSEICDLEHDRRPITPEIEAAYQSAIEGVEK